MRYTKTGDIALVRISEDEEDTNTRLRKEFSGENTD